MVKSFHHGENCVHHGEIVFTMVRFRFTMVNQIHHGEISVHHGKHDIFFVRVLQYNLSLLVGNFFFINLAKRTKLGGNRFISLVAVLIIGLLCVILTI